MFACLSEKSIAGIRRQVLSYKYLKTVIWLQIPNGMLIVSFMDNHELLMINYQKIRLFWEKQILFRPLLAQKSESRHKRKKQTIVTHVWMVHVITLLIFTCNQTKYPLLTAVSLWRLVSDGLFQHLT